MCGNQCAWSIAMDDGLDAVQVKDINVRGLKIQIIID